MINILTFTLGCCILLFSRSGNN